MHSPRDLYHDPPNINMERMDLQGFGSKTRRLEDQIRQIERRLLDLQVISR